MVSSGIHSMVSRARHPNQTVTPRPPRAPHPDARRGCRCRSPPAPCPPLDSDPETTRKPPTGTDRRCGHHTRHLTEHQKYPFTLTVYVLTYIFFLNFFFQSYLHLAYLDYDFILILSAVPPRRSGSMAAPPKISLLHYMVKYRDRRARTVLTHLSE